MEHIDVHLQSFHELSDEQLRDINGGGVNIWKTAGRLAGNVAVGAVTGLAFGGPVGLGGGIIGGMAAGIIAGPVKK